MKKLFLLLFPLTFLSTPILAQRKAPAPTPITYCMPSALRPDATTEITFHGPNLHDAATLWTSFPTEATPLSPRDDKDAKDEVRFSIKLSPDAPVGIYAARLAGPAGPSSLMLLMVDDLPTAPQSAANHSPADAQLLSAPIAIDGACEELKSDYYRVHATKGQRLSFEVVAQRLGSAMDPMMRLLDTAGRELMYCDDAPGAGSDCRFAYTFPADGDYVLEVRDVNYEGGPDHRYRLRVGDFPMPVAAYPPIAKRGAETRFTFEGAGCESLAPHTLKVPEDAKRVWLNMRYEHGSGSGFVPILCSNRATQTEAEPNDTPGNATKIEIPGVLTGRLDRPGDVDYFEFHAAKDQRLSIRGRTRSLGSPCDLSLKLLNEAGGTIIETKPAGADEGNLDAMIPADGIYRLLVHDVTGAGGPGLVYGIDIEPNQPGFSLTLDSDRADAPAGGSSRVKVTCVRRDYSGPITLSLGGDATGFELSNNTIAEGKNETELEIKFPPDAAVGKLMHLTILGAASVRGGEVKFQASTMPALRKVFPRMLYPPTELDGVIAVSARAIEPEKPKGP